MTARLVPTIDNDRQRWRHQHWNKEYKIKGYLTLFIRVHCSCCCIQQNVLCFKGDKAEMARAMTATMGEYRNTKMMPLMVMMTLMPTMAKGNVSFDFLSYLNVPMHSLLPPSSYFLLGIMVFLVAIYPHPYFVLYKTFELFPPPSSASLEYCCMRIFVLLCLFVYGNAHFIHIDFKSLSFAAPFFR